MGVRDSGCGLPAAVLERFRTGGSNVGVGLAGIRERARELGSQLQIVSSAEGAVATASLAYPAGVIWVLRPGKLMRAGSS
jgi:signal transduction histidine kinase